MWQLIVQSLATIGSSPLFGAGRDLLSIFLAIMAIVLSWRAFRMGKDQGRIIDKQVELMTAEVETGKRLEAIVKRQGEIAEVQHKIALEQRQRKSDARVVVADQRRLPGASEEVVITLQIANEGNKAAEGCHWEVMSAGAPIKLLDLDYQQHDTKFDSESQRWVAAGSLTRRLFPGESLKILRVNVNDLSDGTLPEFTLLWRVRTDEGMSPEFGPGVMCFRQFRPSALYGYVYPNQLPKEGQDPFERRPKEAKRLSWP